jgi:hypothetical protein
MRTGSFLIATLFVMAACASDPRNANQMSFDDALAFEKQSPAKLDQANAQLAALSDDEVRIRLNEELANVTSIIKQTGFGIYVEYTAPDNRLYMWYPGNSAVVSGSWGISDDFSPPRACFKYFNAYQGVTGEFEPNECVSTAQTMSGAYVIEKRQGDVFRLSTKGIPYPKSSGNLPPWPEDYAKFSGH